MKCQHNCLRANNGYFLSAIHPWSTSPIHYSANLSYKLYEAIRMYCKAMSELNIVLLNNARIKHGNTKHKLRHRNTAIKQGKQIT